MKPSLPLISRNPAISSTFSRTSNEWVGRGDGTRPVRSIRGGHCRRDCIGETESPTPIVRTHIRRSNLDCGLKQQLSYALLRHRRQARRAVLDAVGRSSYRRKNRVTYPDMEARPMRPIRPIGLAVFGRCRGSSVGVTGAGAGAGVSWTMGAGGSGFDSTGSSG